MSKIRAGSLSALAASLHQFCIHGYVTATCDPMCRLLISLKQTLNQFSINILEGTGESLFTVFASLAQFLITLKLQNYF